MEQHAARARHAVLTFWMVVLGLFACWSAASEILKRWQVLVPGAQICDVVILISGVVLFASGIMQLLTGGKRRVPAALGAAASGLFAATLLVGVLFGAIPCFGSS